MKNKLYSFLIISFLVLYSGDIYAAEDLRDRMKDWGETFSTGGDLFMVIIGVIGVVLMLLGGWGLKKYADDSRSNPLAKPLIFFIAGGILAGVTAFQELLSETLTGEDIDEDTGRDDFKARNIT